MSDRTDQSSRQRLTDQERGKLAWEKIVEVARFSENVKKKYRTQARQFAALVRTNGLAQLLAFLYAKAKPNESTGGDDARAAALMLTHINDALRLLFPQNSQTAPAPNSVLLSLLQRPSQLHRQATVEALAFARWLSRFAEAELPSEEEVAEQQHRGQQP